jgi:hypothetical protein
MGRLEVLAVTAGFFLLMSTPAFAQHRPPEPSALASSDGDENGVSVANDQTPTSAEDEQSQTSVSNDQIEGLTDTNWWWENDGLTVGYLGYGAGSCGAGFQSNRIWQPYTVWWTGDNVNSWSPAGSVGRFSNHFGGCGNYGYGNRTRYILWVNRIPAPTKNHHHTRMHSSDSNSNSGAPATFQQASRELNRASGVDRAGPGDDWTRVDDRIVYSHPQQTAELAHQHAQGIRGGLQHGQRAQSTARARAERIQARQRVHIALARGFGAIHVAARPAARVTTRSVAIRSGVHGHS